MKTYEKPCVLVNEELAEGVYAASGCYVASSKIHQSPEEGRGNYCIQLGATHEAADGHHSTMQTFEVTFNQPVEYVSSLAQSVSGSGSTKLVLSYNYHSNGYECIGLGDLYVISDANLAILDTKCTFCNEECNEHS